MASAPKTQIQSALPGFLRSPSLPMLLTLCALAVGLTALLPLIQSSGATTTNGNIQRLEQERNDAQARLHELELEVATLGGLDRIERESAQRFNMAPAQDTRYITVDVPAPEERRLPSRFLPPQQKKELDRSSLWDRLFGWIPLP